MPVLFEGADAIPSGTDLTVVSPLFPESYSGQRVTDELVLGPSRSSLGLCQGHAFHRQGTGALEKSPLLEAVFTPSQSFGLSELKQCWTSASIYFPEVYTTQSQCIAQLDLSSYGKHFGMYPFVPALTSLSHSHQPTLPKAQARNRLWR